MSSFDLPHSPVDVERLLSERQWVQRLARSLVADPHQADDVAQESWLTALRHPPRHDANLKSWLSQLVRNTAAALRRGESRRSERERSATTPKMGAGSSDVLEPARREALVLMYFEGLAPNVAADGFGLPNYVSSGSPARQRASTTSSRVSGESSPTARGAWCPDRRSLSKCARAKSRASTTTSASSPR